MLDSGSLWLDTVQAASEGVAATYRRGAAEVELTDVVVGQTPIGTDFGVGIIQTWQTRDFLIQAADLILGGAVTEPEVGDTIEESGVIYRVTEADDGRPWRYSDEATRLMLRVHTSRDTRRTT